MASLIAKNLPYIISAVPVIVAGVATTARAIGSGIGSAADSIYGAFSNRYEPG